MRTMDDRTLQEQLEYYRARAQELDPQVGQEYAQAI